MVEARRLVDVGDISGDKVVEALNAMGYDEAAQHVYGMHYNEWKEQHQQKATDEQLEAFQASMKLHAKHDKTLLEPRGNAAKYRHGVSTNAGAGGSARTETTVTSATSQTLSASNVCCQDVPNVSTKTPTVSGTASAPSTPQPGLVRPPPIPTQFHRPPTVAVLTISDRAASGAYVTGDLSGPAVQKAVAACMGTCPKMIMGVVPDDPAIIQAKLRTWCDSVEANCPAADLILTTGGTGLSPRDVTPEATREILDHELSTLMSFCLTESSYRQPLACLSRGTAGIRGNTVIANLPGNPLAMEELIPLLLPLLLHAVADLQEPVTPEVLELE